MPEGINIEVIKTKVTEFVEKHAVINEKLELIQAKTGGKIEKAYIALGILCVPLLLLIMIGAGDFLIDLIGFVYPVYASIKAIESPDKEDDTQWLTYWLIFGIFKMFEGVADAIISFLPFYFLIKVIFLIWAYYPRTKGATTVYNALIKPYVVPFIHALHEEANKRD